MKKIISSGVAIILALGFALAQQEFNLDLSKTYSEKKIVEKIIHHLKKNKSLVALDQDFQTFLKSQYSAQFEEERISGPEATLAFLEKKNADLADIINQEKKDEFSPKFANSANVEMFSDGISKGSLRLLKIRIGEPGLFNLKRISIPVYIYLAGRGNSFSSSNEDEKNKLTYADLLDPLGGGINFSVADKLQFIE